jgi:hypothetical protein
MEGVCESVIPIETVLAGPTRHTVRCHLYSDVEAGVPEPVGSEA